MGQRPYESTTFSRSLISQVSVKTSWVHTALIRRELMLMEINSDHNVIFPPYVAADYAETLDTIFWGGEDEVKGLSFYPSF